MLNDVDIWVFEGAVGCKLYGLQSEKSMKMMKNEKNSRQKSFCLKLFLKGTNKISMQKTQQNSTKKQSKTVGFATFFVAFEGCCCVELCGVMQLCRDDNV